MDEIQKLEIGARIRELRERSPYKQQTVADKLGIGLRAYQKLEEVGTTRYERCEELARIFDVDPIWIWGRGHGPAPDLMGTLSDSSAEVRAQLDRIEGMVAELVAARRPAAHEKRPRRQARPKGSRSSQG